MILKLMKLAVMAGGIFGASLATNAHATSWQFTLIDMDTQADSRGAPSINELGTVAYSNSTGIYTWANGASNLVTNGVGLNATNIGGVSPIINNIGQVAFSYAGPQLYAGTAITTLAGRPISDGTSVTTAVAPNSNQVAFNGQTPNLGYGVYSGTPESVALRMDSHYWETNGKFTQVSPGGPAINDAGNVAFAGQYSPSVNSYRNGIFLYSSTSSTPITEVSSALDDGHAYYSNPIISQNNAVSFVYGTQTSTQLDARSGLYTADASGHINTLVDTDGPFKYVGYNDLNGYALLNGKLDAFSVSESGAFAFEGGTDDGHWGLFTGTDPNSDTVILVGDTLFGKTVSRIAFFHNGLNSNNQLVFRVDTFGSNPTSMIVLATAVPEPESYAMLLVGLGLMGGIARRRKQT